MDTSQIRNKFTEMSKIFREVVDEYDSLKSENLKLKEAIKKHKEAYALMSTVKNRKYNELEQEKKRIEGFL